MKRKLTFESISEADLSESDKQRFWSKVDVSDIEHCWNCTDPVLFQAIKKLLRCGRKHKSMAQDVAEAITTLERWQQMNMEDEK